MTERRRTNRASCDFSISINLCDADNDNTPIGSPIPARITDFTLYGACLNLDKIHCGSHHIFYTTQDHKNHIVSLEYTTDDEDDFLVVFGNPAWYNLFSSEADSSKYKLGIEFLEDQEKETIQRFLAKLAEQKDDEVSWLRKLFR